ncbi:hypothetical protein [Streptomyces griseoviridis]|uniref:DUF2087 domain-containing protein n=1 Tax=Streptomyces griseoviridis TaxID=45398 RepID=A0ABT9LFA3_STRGD|nr:hypothetical protein [Streptomyces griseoviridis]MDP9682404.1 hypothetical protein [Streptomyces griseoviridis]GGS81716.1 hypothetical protein GCM10010240_13830 [Streptomyces griseoviridis]
MSVRDVIDRALRTYYSESAEPGAIARELLDSHQAQALDPVRDWLAKWGHQLPDAARWELRQAAGLPLGDDRGKSSREAEATPELTERQRRLLDAIRTWGGEWTTARVRHLYALTDPGVVQRGTARRDLEALHRAGHLVLVDAPDNRHYLLHRKDGRS